VQMTARTASLRSAAALSMGAGLLCVGASAQPIALVCAARVEPLVIGQISVRDGFSNPTFGSALISCAGGSPGATVRTCLRLGPGGGGAAPGLSPRYMRGSDGQTLDYQLTAHASFSSGGSPIDSLDLPLTLDELGAGSIAPSVHAEITALASLARAGPYLSSFAGGGDITFTYGENACTQSGHASPFDVSAAVVAGCMVEVTSMDFGTVDGAIDLDLDSIAQISISCTNGADYTVGLDFGTNPTDASDTGRRMTNGPNTVRYGLYHDAGRAQGWGLGAGTVASGTGTGGDRYIDIYGRVFGGQAVEAGQYSDTVVVVITY
jgi:spore coat protein U-like protein